MPARPSGGDCALPAGLCLCACVLSLIRARMRELAAHSRWPALAGRMLRAKRLRTSGSDGVGFKFLEGQREWIDRTGFNGLDRTIHGRLGSGQS
jgi:hypothetical protein